jgi:hypothetical protein
MGVTADALANIIDAVSDVRDAVGRHPFEHAVSRFAQVLGCVPDTEPADVSVDEIGLLQTFSEEVIECIEVRVARATVCGPHEQMLISRLYEVRRLLEEIHRWRHHFATRRTS